MSWPRTTVYFKVGRFTSMSHLWVTMPYTMALGGRAIGPTHEHASARGDRPSRDRRQGRCANRLRDMTLRRAIVTLAVIAAALAVLRYVTSNRGA